MSETLLHNDILDVTRYMGPELGFSADRVRYQITDTTSGILITLSAEQWGSLMAAFGARHPGIELRISNVSGELTRADSDQMHHAAKYGNPGGDDWQQLLPGLDWPADTPPPSILKIEIRPVTLGGGGAVDVAEAADGQGAEGAQSADPPADVDGAAAAEGMLM